MRIKICGVTNVGDAEASVEAGADFLGVNFVEGSPRRVSPEVARAIARAMRGHARVVGVVAGDETTEAPTLLRIRDEAELDLLQLHGSESPELVHALGALAWKAVRIATPEDAAVADRYEGLLLLDAKVVGALGGTGTRIDADLAASVARRRDVILAGGLDPDNVAGAIAAVRPWGVDVASGVESSPGVKDLAKVRAFISAARGS